MVVVALVAMVCTIPLQLKYIREEVNHLYLGSMMAGAADMYDQIAEIPDEWADSCRTTAREFSAWWKERYKEHEAGIGYDPLKHEPLRSQLFRRYADSIEKLSETQRRQLLFPSRLHSFNPMRVWIATLGPTVALILLLAWLCRPATIRWPRVVIVCPERTSPAQNSGNYDGC